MNEIYFRRRLTSIMADNKFDRRVRNKESGKIDLHRLPKVAVGSNRVFTKKQERKGKKYNIVIVVDCSGSMIDGYGPGYALAYNDPSRSDISNSPQSIAADCATTLNDNFKKIGVRSAIVAYSGGRYDNEKIPNPEEIRSLTYQVKGLNEHMDAQTAYANIMNYGGGGTPTDAALMRAYNILRKEDGENMVVVLTDGQPNSVDTVKMVLAKNKNVATMGIGIGVDAQRFIKGVSVGSKDDLFNSFLNLISEQIKRG